MIIYCSDMTTEEWSKKIDLKPGVFECRQCFKKIPIDVPILCEVEGKDTPLRGFETKEHGCGRNEMSAIFSIDDPEIIGAVKCLMGEK